jgi:hypothetical protein
MMKGSQMAANQWQELFNSLRFEPGKPCATSSDAKISEFEKSSGFRLPASYGAWVKLFGPGELSKCFRIVAPGFTEIGDACDLMSFMRASQEDVHDDDVAAYAPDAAQFRRMIFFCEDVGTHHYGWDPAEVTDKARNECAIYVFFREWEVRRLADTFAEFIQDIVLGERHAELYEDAPQSIWTVPYKLRGAKT